jgi:hypothetical protein
MHANLKQLLTPKIIMKNTCLETLKLVDIGGSDGAFNLTKWRYGYRQF